MNAGDFSMSLLDTNQTKKKPGLNHGGTACEDNSILSEPTQKIARTSVDEFENRIFY